MPVASAESQEMTKVLVIASATLTSTSFAGGRNMDVFLPEGGTASIPSAVYAEIRGL